MKPPVLSKALLCAAVATTTVSCKKYDPLYCDESTPCTDPGRPFCDLHGTYPASDGVGRTCIPDPSDAGTAIPCNAPGTALRCDKDNLVVCDQDSVEQSALCPFNCDPKALRCRDFAPSNGLGDLWDQAQQSPPIELTGHASIDSDTGSVTDGDGAAIIVPSTMLPAPPDGVPVRVVTASTVSIEGLDVHGDSALAIVSAGDVVVTGLLSVSGTNNLTGAGSLKGDWPCTGQVGVMGVLSGHIQQAGGGGGGNRAPGGSGGDVNLEAAGGAGGAAFSTEDSDPSARRMRGHVRYERRRRRPDRLPCGHQHHLDWHGERQR